MLTFEIVPGESVGPVSIGMSRNQVHSVLGMPENVVPGPSERHWFLGGLVRRYLTPSGFLMRPHLDGGTLGRHAVSWAPGDLLVLGTDARLRAGKSWRSAAAAWRLATCACQRERFSNGRWGRA